MASRRREAAELHAEDEGDPEVDVDEEEGHVDMIGHIRAEVYNRRATKHKRRRTQRAYSGKLPFALSRIIAEANEAFANGDHAGAIAACREVVKAAPSYPESYSLLGLIYEDMGQQQKALDSYIIAVHANEKDARSWKSLGLLYKAMGQQKEAAHAFARAARLDADDANAAADAGACYHEAGEPKAAIKWYQHALRNPQLTAQSTVRLDLAKLLFAQGEKEQVVQMLLECLNWVTGLRSDSTAGASEASPLEAEAVATSGSGAVLLRPQPAHIQDGFVACNMLCEVWLGEQKNQQVVSVVQRTYGFAMDVAEATRTRTRLTTPASEKPLDIDRASELLPFDLLGAYAVAKIRLGDFASVSKLVGAFEVAEPTEWADFQLQLALGCIGIKQFAVAQRLLKRLRDTSAVRVADPADAYAQAAALADRALIFATLSQQQMYEMLLGEHEMYTALGQKELALASLVQAAYCGRPDAQLLLRAAAQLRDAGHVAVAIELLTDAQILQSLGHEEDVAIALYRAAELHKAQGDHVEYANLLERALGMSTPLAPQQARARRLRAVQREMGDQSVLAATVQQVCDTWVVSGEGVRATRLVRMVVRATRMARDMVAKEAAAAEAAAAAAEEDGSDGERDLQEVGLPDAAAAAIRSVVDDKRSAPKRRKVAAEPRRGKRPSRFAFALDDEEVDAIVRERGVPPAVLHAQVWSTMMRHPQYTHLAGMWSLLRALDGADRDPTRARRERASRKSAIRQCLRHPDALQLLVYIGNLCISSKSYNMASLMYYEAFRLSPREPLLSLCLGVALLCQMGSRVVSRKHTLLMKALALLANYRQLRKEQMEAEDAEEESATAAAASDPAMAPAVLPSWLVRAETSYNIGRACHQIGMLHLAVDCYETTLSCAGEPVAADLDIRREAALNYVQLLRSSGNEAKALEVCAKHLRYE